MGKRGILFCSGAAAIAGSALALDVDLTGNNGALQWDSVVAHEYQILWGGQVTQIDQPRGRILTAIDTNRSGPVTLEGGKCWLCCWLKGARGVRRLTRCRSNGARQTGKWLPRTKRERLTWPGDT